MPPYLPRLNAESKRQRNVKGVFSSIPQIFQGKPITCCCCCEAGARVKKGVESGVESHFGKLSVLSTGYVSLRCAFGLMLVVTRFKLQLAIGRYPRGSERGVNKSNTPSLFSSSAVSGPITGNADVNKEIACETDKKNTNCERHSYNKVPVSLLRRSRIIFLL